MGCSGGAHPAALWSSPPTTWPRGEEPEQSGAGSGGSSALHIWAFLSDEPKKPFAWGEKAISATAAGPGGCTFRSNFFFFFFHFFGVEL